MRGQRFLGTLLLAMSWSAMGVAAEAAHELDIKQAGLNEKMTQMDRLEATFGRYQVIRDNDYYGESGVLSQFQKWNDETNKWISSWQNSTLILARVTELNSANVRAAIKKDLDQKSLDLDKLVSNYAELMLRNSRGLQSASSVERLRESMLATSGTEPLVRSVNQNLDRLNTMFQEIQTRVTGKFKDQLMQVHQHGQILFQAKLDKAALEFPELKAVSEQLKAQIRAEALVLPAFHTLWIRTTKIQKSIIDRRIFAAETELNELKAFVQEKVQVIAAADLNEKEKTWGRNLLLNTLKDNEAKLREDMAALTKNQFVLSYFVKVLDHAELACAVGNPQRATVNCLLMRELQGLVRYEAIGIFVDRDLSALNTMDEGMLRYIEGALDKVMAGPAATAEVRR